MSIPPPTPSAPYASDDGLNARQMAAADRLVEVGMELAEALERQASEPGAPRLFAGDLAWPSAASRGQCGSA